MQQWNPVQGNSDEVILSKNQCPMRIYSLWIHFHKVFLTKVKSLFSSTTVSFGVNLLNHFYLFKKNFFLICSHFWPSYYIFKGAWSWLSCSFCRYTVQNITFSQIRQHCTSTFLPISFHQKMQTQTVSTQNLCTTLMYKKAAHKKLVKLAPFQVSSFL